MSAAVRPIHVPGTAALDTLRRRAQAALDAWARDWVSAAQPVIVLQIGVASDAARRQPREHYAAVRTEAGCMWFRCGDADRASFGRAVVGGELMPESACADDWIAAAVERAWDTRNRALCSALLATPISDAPTATEMPTSLFAFGSGAVELSCETLGLHAIADGSVWRSAPTGRAAAHLPKLTPLDRAAQRAVAQLDVTLGSVEVELPKLLDLRRGDVLRLPQRLDRGIVVLCAGKPLARAVLGEAQGRKCVRLLANINDKQ